MSHGLPPRNKNPGGVSRAESSAAVSHRRDTSFVMPVTSIRTLEMGPQLLPRGWLTNVPGLFKSAIQAQAVDHWSEDLNQWHLKPQRSSRSTSVACASSITT